MNCSSIDGFDSQKRPLPLVFKGMGGLQRIEGTDDDRSSITCDASDFAVGAVLSQKHEDGEHPMVFERRKMNPA